ncbi:hypothetical protein Y717_22835 [Streptomyces scopuliridis RB72]|uniref:Uncharacterized protein n=1 Tax=Streptomyces scopuliridis RB72 TaxID=1440053 RepID=A0A2T7TD84_9ACTN|nr:hypothetical protein Y717_22835 [Streptomyces scopuliridis RB72]
MPMLVLMRHTLPEVQMVRAAAAPDGRVRRVARDAVSVRLW